MHTNISLINVVNLSTTLYFSSILTASSPLLSICLLQFIHCTCIFYTISLFMTRWVLYNFLNHDRVYFSIFTRLHLRFLQFICCAAFSMLGSSSHLWLRVSPIHCAEYCVDLISLFTIPSPLFLTAPFTYIPYILSVITNFNCVNHNIV